MIVTCWRRCRYGHHQPRYGRRIDTESIAPASVTPTLQGRSGSFWGYFSANRGAVAGMIVVIAVLADGRVRRAIAPYPPNLTNNRFLQPPACRPEVVGLSARHRRDRGHRSRLI